MRPKRLEIGRRAIGGAVITLLLIVSQCAGVPVRDGGDASLLPRLAKRFWIAAEPARILGPANLYEEIDGEAELFLPFGFRELTVGIVSPAGNEKAEVRLELFRHETPRDAFGIYSQHRFPGQEVIRVGTSEAVVSAKSLDFFRGTAFVRLRTASRHATREDLENLGRDLSDLLPGTGDPPPETLALRIPGLVEGSVVFHKRALLGYEVLAPGYEAKYEEGGISGTLILIDAEDVGPAPQFLRKLSGALPGFARLEEGLIRADLPSGTLWIRFRERDPIGIAGKVTREQAEAVILQVAKRLPRRYQGNREEGRENIEMFRPARRK
jgi:hypothetical protein